MMLSKGISVEAAVEIFEVVHHSIVVERKPLTKNHRIPTARELEIIVEKWKKANLSP